MGAILLWGLIVLNLPVFVLACLLRNDFTVCDRFVHWYRVLAEETFAKLQGE